MNISALALSEVQTPQGSGESVLRLIFIPDLVIVLEIQVQSQVQFGTVVLRSTRFHQFDAQFRRLREVRQVGFVKLDGEHLVPAFGDRRKFALEAMFDL